MSTEPVGTKASGRAGTRAVHELPGLGQLDRLLGDVLSEERIAVTERSAVFRVRTGAADGRALALKVGLAPAGAEELARLGSELARLAATRHPHVADVHGFGVLPGGQPFLTLELLASDSLAARLAGRGWGALYDAAIQAASGLAHLHRLGIVHLDVKPRNVGLAPGPDLRLKLLDPGPERRSEALARRLRSEPAYTAPEVLLGEGWDARADLYSLGLVLFELATGVLPSAGTEREALRFHLEGEAPHASSLRPDLPPALVRILRRLLRRDPAERFPSAERLLAALGEAAGRPVEAPAPKPGPAGGLLASRPVGRQVALERLRAAVREAAAGRGGVVMVEGGEGLGKSRLLREIRPLAVLARARVAEGRGGEGTAPLAPLLEAMDALGIERPAAPAPSPGAEPTTGERWLALRALAGRLAEAARADGPIVLLLDDFNVFPGPPGSLGSPISPGSLRSPGSHRAVGERLLGFLAGELAAAPVLLVAAGMSAGAAGEGSPLEGAEVAEDAEENSGGLRRLRLAALDRTETACLADALLGTSGLPASFYAAVYEGTRGSPGMVRELLAGWIEDGVLQGRAGHWRPALASLTWAGGPAAEGRRLDALALGDRTALEAAAVLGRPFGLAALAPLLGEEHAKVHERLEALTAAGWLDRWAGPAGTTYALCGSGPRREIEQALAPEIRAGLELRAGELLAARAAVPAGGSAASPALPGIPLLLATPATPASPADVAGHFWRAGERAASLPWQLAAAADADAAQAPQEAAVFYLRAAAAAQAAGDPGEAAWARAAAGSCLASWAALCEDPAERLAAARAVAEIAATAARTAWAGDAGHPGGETAARVSAARLLLARARLASRGCEPSIAGMADIATVVDATEVADIAGVADIAVESCDEALALLGGPHQPTSGQPAAHAERVLEVDLLHEKALALARLGEAAAAREALRAAYACAEGLPGRQAALLATLGSLRATQGEPVRAVRLLAGAARRTVRLGDKGLRLSAHLSLAEQLGRLGETARAGALLAGEVAAARQAGDLWSERRALSALGAVERSRGEMAAAREALTGALDLALRLGEREEAAEALLALAQVEETLGDWTHAERSRKRAAALLPAGHRLRLAVACGLAGLDRKRGRPGDAERRLSESLSAATGPAGALAACVHLELALLAAERADLDGASAHLGRALTALCHAGPAAGFPGSQDSLGAAVHLAGCDLALRRHDRVQAERHAGEVRRLAGSAGDRLALARLKAVEGRLAADAFDVDLAERTFAEAVRRLGELGAPYERAAALQDWAEATGNPEPALDRLGRAAALYDSLGAEAAARRARAAAERIRDRRRASRPEAERARPAPREEGEPPRRAAASSHVLDSLVGHSRAICELKRTLERVAQGPSTVLIRGESGTGKGLVGRVLHAISRRRDAPFIHFNCAALPETLIESELFGHEKGAFTGAAGQKPGRFELANHGTIFLDEIGKISRAIQAKLLRVVEEKVFERVGGTRTLRCDVRVVAATNLDLERAIAVDEFREDLYYRLNIIPIVLPPLRARKEDIPYLVESFLDRISRDLGMPYRPLAPAVLDLFAAHDWPGNVRELEAAIHRALVLGAGEVLSLGDFAWIADLVQGWRPAAPASPATHALIDLPAATPPPERLASGGYEEALERYDRELLAQALAQCDGKIRETARLLGIARNTLKAKMRRYGLEGNGG